MERERRRSESIKKEMDIRKVLNGEEGMVGRRNGRGLGGEGKVRWSEDGSVRGGSSLLSLDDRLGGGGSACMTSHRGTYVMVYMLPSSLVRMIIRWC